MQPKLLIIFAILGITAFAIFNLISSHPTQQVIASFVLVGICFNDKKRANCIALFFINEICCARYFYF